MDFETYREWTRETAVYPKDIEEQYLVMGLANEVGEFLGKCKKELRGDGVTLEDKVGELLGKFKKEIRGDGAKYGDKIQELGDVFWYMARLVDHYGLSHQEILATNFKKLEDRKKRGVIKGDGDNR